MSESFKAKFRDFLIYSIGEPLVRKLEKSLGEYSLIGDTAFFEPENFPAYFSWVPELEANWKVIRQELDEILQYKEHLPNFQDISPDQAKSTSQDDRWKTFFLYAYGYKAEKNCQRCPQTTSLIENIPGMKTAFFSILLPGKHIPEHRGPYKGVVRYLLALKVPEPREKCRIRVAQETRHWQEGKGLMFDDSLPHEAWNETDDIRVVLFLDIVRPLRFPMSMINDWFLKLIASSPYVQDGKANQEKWDEKLEKIWHKV